jgi:hypothetical protein
MVVTRVLLSGSTNGRCIPITAVATAGTLVHTAHGTAIDAMYIWATNVTGNNVLLTIEWGGVLDPSDHIIKRMEIEGWSTQSILRGQCLSGGLAARAFLTAPASAAVLGAVNISGFVLRFE